MLLTEERGEGRVVGRLLDCFVSTGKTRTVRGFPPFEPDRSFGTPGSFPFTLLTLTQGTGPLIFDPLLDINPVKCVVCVQMAR